MRCDPIMRVTPFEAFRCGRIILSHYCAVLALLLACLSAHAANTQYYYDDLGRIVQAIGSDGSIRQYQYDENGNLLAINRISASVLTVSGLTPLVGHVGASVTIPGTGFSATANQNDVRFGAISAIVNSATTTRLVVTVPAGAVTGCHGETRLPIARPAAVRYHDLPASYFTNAGHDHDKTLIQRPDHPAEIGTGRKSMAGRNRVLRGKRR